MDVNATQEPDDAPHTGLYYGMTPLMMVMHYLSRAKYQAKKRCVELLLKANADVNIMYPNETFKTVLHESTKYPEIVKLLLQAGAVLQPSEPDEGELERPDYWSTPLSLATSHIVPETVKLLLEAGADPNFEDGEWNYPIVFAGRDSSLDSLKLLVEYGADLNKIAYNYDFGDLYHGGTALTNAIYAGAFQCAEYLVSMGAQLAEKQFTYYNQHAETELFLAARAQNTNCIKLLLREDIKINRTDTRYHNALQEYIMKDNRKRCEKMSWEKFDKIKPEVAVMLYAAGEILEMEKIASTQVPECLADLVAPKLCLMDDCRKAIRKHLIHLNPGKNLFLRVPELGLPELMQSYLLYDCTLEYDTSTNGSESESNASDYDSNMDRDSSSNGDSSESESSSESDLSDN